MRPDRRSNAELATRPGGRTLPTPHSPRSTRRQGFTLVELLIVIFIILLISAVALPSILPALNHRQISEAARALQGALVGARDQAIHSNQPSGVRLLPDPTLNGIGAAGLLDSSQILASSRIIPLSPAPEYSEGMVTVTTLNVPRPVGALPAPLVPYPIPSPSGTVYYPVNFGAAGMPNVLMLEESPYDATTGLLNTPTSWFWNVRVGDKIQINGAGPWYTVVGPMVVTPFGNASGNAEMFVNVGMPGTVSPVARTNVKTGATYYPEFLFLVNGQDDDGNGWTDEGWDGVNNNIGPNPYDPTGTLVDDYSEWETETWLGTLATNPVTNQPYTIRRRPAPSVNAREVALPSSVVIDLTGWGPYVNASGTNPPPQERSIVPMTMFNMLTGYVDIMINPDGSVLPTTIYSSPSSFSLGSAFTHLWLADRADLAAPSVSRTAHPFLPLPQGLGTTLFNGQEIKGNYALLTIFNRTGEIVVNENMTFDDPALAATQGRTYNAFLPFLPAQQGVSGGGQ